MPEEPKKIGTEVLLRLGRVGVKPRKLELKRRIEEDTAIVRAVSVCCGEDQSFAYGGEKVYNNGDISKGLYG